ncbi:MAG: hypothetical protein IT287_00245, partial [Bdellovibrionaceae bacterium]|nr:hypothetical protein [Pseudobdellovibrionaceae bacterium]
ISGLKDSKNYFHSKTKKPIKVVSFNNFNDSPIGMEFEILVSPDDSFVAAKNDEIRGGFFGDVLVPGEEAGKLETKFLRQYLYVKGDRKNELQVSLSENTDGAVPSTFFVKLKAITSDECGFDL